MSKNQKGGLKTTDFTQKLTRRPHDGRFQNKTGHIPQVTLTKRPDENTYQHTAAALSLVSFELHKGEK